MAPPAPPLARPRRRPAPPRPTATAAAAAPPHCRTTTAARSSSPQLEQCGLSPAMYLPEWLMPLWSRTLRPEVYRVVWLLLLTDGDALLLRATLAVLACIAPQLLRCTELPDLRRLLSVGALEIDLPAFVGALERCVVTEHDLRVLRFATPSAPCGA